MDKITRIDRKLIHKGKIVTFYEDTMKMPNGNTTTWDFLEHRGAAAIVAEDEDGKLLMVRQYRGPVDRETLEIPAGGLNAGEDFKTCAMRELEEETGYRTEDSKLLLDLYTTAAFCNEKIEIYYTDKIIPSHQNLDEDEYVAIERYTIDELTDMILDGTIRDAKTISAVLAYRALKERQA